MSCKPEALRDAGTALQPCWRLWGYKQLSCPHPSRATCKAQAHRYGLQPSQALPPMQVALLSLFQPPLAPFPSLEISREPVLLSRQPWVANHSRGSGDSWDPQHRKSTSPPCECLAGGQAVQGQRGKERRAVQEEKVWAGRLQARQPREGQSLVTCSRWSRMRLPEGSAEVETVEPGSGGR